MLAARVVAQQIPLYSEMYFLRMLYNPALTSYNGSSDLFGFYRDQWTGIPGHPVTGGAVGDMSLWDDRIGVGFHVYSDNSSIIHRLNAQLYYAQKIHIAQDHVISLGVSAGAMNTYIDFNNAIATGMQATVLPSHQAGWMDAGNSFYLAMPRLPNQSPFETVYFKDKESGASLRHYWGVQFGKDNRSYVRDCTWGSTLIAEDSMRMIFPM
jgi:type IX secretion system PorP/SprF family membrane protein